MNLLRSLFHTVKKEVVTLSEQARAFTLIETLVAITVLSIAIVGPYSIASVAVKASRVSAEDLVASFLAQEGVEFVRAVRDSNFLERIYGGGAGGWMEGLEACVASAGCMVDPTSLETFACDDGGNAPCQPLYISESGLYNHQGEGTETPYIRTVRLTPLYHNISAMRVEVTVSWDSRGGTRSVSVEEVLEEWL